MSSPHHHSEPQTPEQQALIRRFFDEASGAAEREYPNGRLGPDDDGTLTYAVAADRRHGVIKIVFSTPTGWLGLDIKAAEELRDTLTKKILELRVGNT